MCPVDEIGRNSVSPSVTPKMIDWNIFIEDSIQVIGVRRQGIEWFADHAD
jgi:hypothetical protein